MSAPPPASAPAAAPTTTPASATSFSVKVSNYRQNPMLNICDPELVGQTVSDGKRNLSISRGYYCERIVGLREAEELLRTSSIINMAGERTVSLSVGLGIGIESGIKRVAGVPFLIVFRM